jgi:hypothetical protein
MFGTPGYPQNRVRSPAASGPRWTIEVGSPPPGGRGVREGLRAGGRALCVDNGGMVCKACQDERHTECRGGTWCDCQHLPPEQRNQEPAINWVRQG